MLHIISDVVSFSIRLTEEEKTIFEKIEDKYDTAVGDAAYKRYLDNPKTHTHTEVLKMFDNEE